jgi:hypothetical protein
MTLEMGPIWRMKNGFRRRVIDAIFSPVFCRESRGNAVEIGDELQDSRRESTEMA